MFVSSIIDLFFEDGGVAVSAISNNQVAPPEISLQPKTSETNDFDWELLDKLLSPAQKPRGPSNEFVDMALSYFTIDFTKLKVQPSKKEDGNVSGK